MKKIKRGSPEYKDLFDKWVFVEKILNDIKSEDDIPLERYIEFEQDFFIEFY
jgi:hypothetical protein